MNLFRLNVALLILLVALLAGVWMLRRNPEQRSMELLPDMQYSPAYAAYEPNPVLANRQTLQTQPVGSIARGEVPLHYAATPEDAVRAGEELKTPFDANDPQVVTAGQEVYSVYCAVCHGSQGLGDGPVAKRGYPPPPSLLTGKSAQMKDGQLFHIVTYGQGGMAPYASQLSPEDRWRVVAYVKDLQSQAALPEGEEEKKEVEAADLEEKTDADLEPDAATDTDVDSNSDSEDEPEATPNDESEK